MLSSSFCSFSSSFHATSVLLSSDQAATLIQKQFRRKSTGVAEQQSGEGSSAQQTEGYREYNRPLHQQNLSVSEEDHDDDEAAIRTKRKAPLRRRFSNDGDEPYISRMPPRRPSEDFTDSEDEESLSLSFSSLPKRARRKGRRIRGSDEDELCSPRTPPKRRDVDVEDSLSNLMSEDDEPIIASEAVESELPSPPFRGLSTKRPSKDKIHADSIFPPRRRSSDNLVDIGSSDDENPFEVAALERKRSNDTASRTSSPLMSMVPPSRPSSVVNHDKSGVPTNLEIPILPTSSHSSNKLGSSHHRRVSRTSSFEDDGPPSPDQLAAAAMVGFEDTKSRRQSLEYREDGEWSDDDSDEETKREEDGDGKPKRSSLDMWKKAGMAAMAAGGFGMLAAKALTKDDDADDGGAGNFNDGGGQGITPDATTAADVGQAAQGAGGGPAPSQPAPTTAPTAPAPTVTAPPMPMVNPAQ